MAPAFGDGECLMIDALAPLQSGDLVVIWQHLEITPVGQHQAIVKRLVAVLGDVVVFEMLNPLRRSEMSLNNIAAIHKCLGSVPSSMKRVKFSDEHLIRMQGMAA